MSPTHTSKFLAGSLLSSFSLSSGGTILLSSFVPPSFNDLNANSNSTLDVKLDSFETFTPL